jgi:hypothetical protein
LHYPPGIFFRPWSFAPFGNLAGGQKNSFSGGGRGQWHRFLTCENGSTGFQPVGPYLLKLILQSFMSLWLIRKYEKVWSFEVLTFDLGL